MNMLTMQEDLTADERVCEKRIVNHMGYFSPVLQVRYGWKKHGEIVWDTTYEVRNFEQSEQLGIRKVQDNETT
jgi:hypothetical protein